MNKNILSILFSLWVGFIFGSTPADTFQLANKALLQKNYYDAIQLYESIHNGGYYSISLYYNLGSALLKTNQIAAARLYFEKAIYEDPLNQDISKNIESIRNRIADYYAFPKYPFFPTIEYIHSHIGHRLISILLWLFFIIALTSWYINRVKQINIFKWFALTCLTFLLVLTGLFFIEQTYKNFHEDMCILFEREVSLYEQPDIHSSVLGTLSEGFKYKIEEVIGEFTKIELGDGSQGWIKTNNYKYILEKRKADV